MFKRQKPDAAPLGKPEAVSGSTLSSWPPAQPATRPSGVSGQTPSQVTPARPAGLALQPKAQLSAVDPIPAPALANPLPPIRSAVPSANPASTSSAQRDVSQRRTLVVGRGISVQGTVQDAERLVVEGTVEASMVHAAELAVSAGGMFKGGAEVEDAEVAGTIDGTLTVRGSLIVRATGKVLGTAHCRRLQVEDGGEINGQVEMLTAPVRSDRARVMEPAE